MEKELFDKAMERRGWIPKGKVKINLASDDPNVDWTKIDDMHKYSHKCGMTISVDDEEIKNVEEDLFYSWYEEAAKNYFNSRLYAFSRGERVVEDDGEYITAECTTEAFMDMQIDRLTVQDDYKVLTKGKRFSFSRFKKVYTTTFFKPVLWEA